MMLSNLSLDFEKSTTAIASVSVDGVEHILSFESVEKYWNYATPDELEGGRIHLFGDLVLGFLLVASGQGGIVFIWDPAADELLHVSEGAYTIAVTADDKYVYALSENTGSSEGDVMITRAPRGTMDAYTELQPISCPSPIPIDEYEGDFASINISIENDTLIAIIKGIEYRSKLSIS